MKTITHAMRGIPFFLLKEYLQEMGGTEIRADVIQGAGWTVHLERMEPFKLGSLSVGQVKLMIELEESAEEEFTKKFAMKTLRAGG